MDAIKKQLDVLMATNRNGDVREVDRRYYDRNVSRLFLSGLCSHETFQLIKMPSIQLWNDGKKQAEVIGSHKAYLPKLLDEKQTTIASSFFIPCTSLEVVE